MHVRKNTPRISCPPPENIMPQSPQLARPNSRWEDHTLASTWRRAPRSYSSSGSMMEEEEAPFGKVTLSKLLVLKDKDTREDYFAQQAAFVTL